MNHFATPDFWHRYRHLPQEVRALADKNFALTPTPRTSRCHPATCSAAWDPEKVAKLPPPGCHFFQSLNTRKIDFHVKNRPDNMATEVPGINPSRWGSEGGPSVDR
jgi:hypothetical protein